ncbi:hypothetical protein A986_22350 [Pseudomonas fluorescens BRIP34879]|nr:hypothetical protein A986_22350 [Pseudomonas fluorescens BRIP34879]KRP49554.1 hypothetical protein TU75_16155 [Pseudomonas poae]
MWKGLLPIALSQLIHVWLTHRHREQALPDTSCQKPADQAQRQQDDLVKTARHVVANPLRAGLVDRIGDYPLWDAVWL